MKKKPSFQNMRRLYLAFSPVFPNPNLTSHLATPWVFFYLVAVYSLTPDSTELSVELLSHQ